MHTSEIGTTATDKLDGDKTVIADAESTVTDKVGTTMCSPARPTPWPVS